MSSVGCGSWPLTLIVRGGRPAVPANTRKLRRVTDGKDAAKPVSMTKASSSDDGAAATASRPRTVLAATIALGISGLAALGAATALYGQTGWLHDKQSEANSKAATSAIASARSSAASATHDVSQATASAASVNATKYPTSGSRLDDQVHQQQNGALIMSVVLVVAIGFMAYGVFRGRHWARWGMIAFWAVASFTGTFAGLLYLVAVGSDSPAPFKALSFVSAAALLAAVVLCNLRPSFQYFALSRPTHAGAQRRGLFAPRVPQGDLRRPPGSRVGKPTSPLTTSAADRGDAYLEKQRAKKRSAAANAEAIHRGAELARSRAKASKSRRNMDRPT